MSETGFRIGAWELDVSDGAASLGTPVFALGKLEDVRVGPHPRDAAFDAHIAATTGSSVVWGDEWRFNPADGRLVSLIWGVPERNAEIPPLLGPVRPATLRLKSMSGEIDMPDTRAFTPDRLVCGRVEPLLRPVRYLVAPDLSVLVQDGQWWGWALDRPLHHLADGPAPPDLAPLMAEWFQLVSADTLDALNEADPDLGAAMIHLRDRAAALAGPAADELVTSIESVWKGSFDA